VYLYAESKEALFDLAVRRSWEDPLIWGIPLPHRSPERGEIADHLWRCLQNAAQFPRLWLAIDSPVPTPREVRAEMEGILHELADWLHRYRKAIMLIERSASDWPDLAQVFTRRFWRGGVHRIADYLGRRAGGANSVVLAHVTVETLRWAMVHRHWSEDSAGLPAEPVKSIVDAMLLHALTTTR
jgi:AcrR family transcriptional regulator